MQISVNLKAGVKQSAGNSGSYLAVMDIGAAGNLQLSIFSGTSELEHITTAMRGLTLEAGQRFDRVELLAANDCTVQIVVSDGLVRIGTLDGANVNATIIGGPLAVSNDRGTAGAPMYVSAVSFADAPATGATNASVNCTPAGVAVAAANAATRELRFFNQGPDPVAIVPPGGTWAGRVKVLEVGDMFIETRGPNLAWTGITDASKAATVTVERINA